MGFVWQAERDGFWVLGPVTGVEVAKLGWFPPDAVVEVWRGAARETILWSDLVDAQFSAGVELRLPGNPTGGGPLVYVMDRLLGERGCPWDREQTPRSLLHYLLDEAYEAAAAILDEDWALARDELGDVLLQVVFFSALEAKVGRWDFDAVVREQAAKLVRRHPHVFGDLDLDTGEQVRERWESFKASEGPKGTGDESVMPALMAASRKAKRGIMPVDAGMEAWRSRILQAGESLQEAGRRHMLEMVLWAIVTVGRSWHLEAEWVLWESIRSLQKSG